MAIDGVLDATRAQAQDRETRRIIFKGRQKKTEGCVSGLALSETREFKEKTTALTAQDAKHRVVMAFKIVVVIACVSFSKGPNTY